MYTSGVVVGSKALDIVAMNAQFQRDEIIWHVITIDRLLSGEIFWQ